MALTGCEARALRAGRGQLKEESYVFLRDGEL